MASRGMGVSGHPLFALVENATQIFLETRRTPGCTSMKLSLTNFASVCGTKEGDEGLFLP
ncbi:MAG: hypothetical protein DYH12_14035 [Sorangiineae bacterium PRO1]|nr:hypothetical protein [Sorangiineae bacterium PRO1]